MNPIDDIKKLYADAVGNDVRIIEQKYKDKLDECRNKLNEEMNAVIKEMLLSQDNAMRMEIRELKTMRRNEQ